MQAGFNILDMNLLHFLQLLKRHLRGGVPKYVSFKDAFIEAIISGALQSGDRVPSEQELAAALPMSLGTIQRALRDLAATGFIERRPGHGSFVTGMTGRAEMAQPFHCRFLSDDGKSYLPVYPEVLGRNLQPAHGPWNEILGARSTVEITRRIRIGDEFSVYSVFYVDGDRLPVFQNIELSELNNSNFKEVILKACGRAVANIDLMIRQQVIPATIGKKIGVSPDVVCTSIRAVGHLTTGDPVYYQHIHIPPSSRELHIVSNSQDPGLT